MTVWLPHKRVRDDGTAETCKKAGMLLLLRSKAKESRLACEQLIDMMPLDVQIVFDAPEELALHAVQFLLREPGV